MFTSSREWNFWLGEAIFQGELCRELWLQSSPEVHRSTYGLIKPKSGVLVNV
jgi:hypothetical protein